MKNNKLGEDIKKFTVKATTGTPIIDVFKGIDVSPKLEKHNNGKYSITYDNGNFEYISERLYNHINQPITPNSNVESALEKFIELSVMTTENVLKYTDDYGRGWHTALIETKNTIKAELSKIPALEKETNLMIDERNDWQKEALKLQSERNAIEEAVNDKGTQLSDRLMNVSEILNRSDNK